MLFCSQIFLFYFLPVFILFYLALGRARRVLVLTVFSYAFYGWWNWKFTLLLLFSTAIDYFCGLGIHRSDIPRVRRAYLVASMVMNLTLLGFGKDGGKQIPVKLRIDTPIEVEYYKHGGILPYVLRQLLAA